MRADPIRFLRRLGRSQRPVLRQLAGPVATPVRRSLRVRIALALSLTSSAILLLCGWFFFGYTRTLVIDRAEDYALGMAATVASGLPRETLERYVQTELSGNPDLTARGILLAQLQKVADEADLADLYLVNRSNGIILDARRRLEFGQEDFGLSLAWPSVDAAWSRRRPVAAPLLDRPQAGYRIAAFAPVASVDGSILALVGAERALPGLAITDESRSAFLVIIAGGVLLSLVAAAAVSSTILRPVERLVRGIRASDRSGYPPPIPPAGQDEIGFLTREFNRLIDELREKDAALRALYGREKARADLVLASIPTGVIGVDAEGRVRLWNPAAASILGLDEASALGARLPDLDLPAGLRAALQAAADGAAAGHLRMRWRSGGRALQLEVASVPYRDEGGAPLGAVAIVNDVTERLRLEEELRIRERLAALGEMSGGIAHEVRNPLAAMEGFAALLARRLEDPSQASLLQGIRREIGVLNEIVTTFSRFARSPVLRRRSVELRALLEELLPYFVDRGVEIRLDLDGVPPLSADPEELRTAFANLLRNAVEAQPRGGSVIVEAAFDAERRVHRVRIRDHGPGVSPEAVDKIFNPFFTTKSEGTGMGLALVHRIVTAHGGIIRLLSDPGPGATFEVELPLVEG